MKEKISIVFIPFLILSILTIFLYTLFRWTLDVKLNILKLKEDVLDYWMPVGLGLLVSVLALRKRLRILQINGKRDNGYFLYQLIAAAIIIIPTIASQNYVEKSSYDLIQVNNIQDVSQTTYNKYYKIDKFKVNGGLTNSYGTARTSGRHNENLSFSLYFVCPFVDSTLTRAANFSYWYVTKYHHRISNRISQTEKDREYESFVNKSISEFERIDFHNVSYFENVPYSDDRDGYIEAVKKVMTEDGLKHVVFLEPHHDKFSERTGNSLLWIFGGLIGGLIIFFLMTVIPTIDKPGLKRYLEKKPLQEDDLKFFLLFLLPQKKHLATPIILDINILVFIVMVISGLNVISPTAKELLDWGGNRRLEIQNGEIWRLLTSTFLHAGLMHLVMNMFGLALVGAILEPIMKSFKLFAAYIITGLIASYTSFMLHENTVSVGASGAIFGLYGIMIAFLVLRIFPKQISGIYWTLIGLYAGVSLLFGFLGGIDNAAHLGGLASGFVIGLFFGLLERKKLKKNAS